MNKIKIINKTRKDMTNDLKDLKKRSKSIFENIKTTPFNYVTLGIMEGVGLEDKEIKNKPLIGVVNTWNELNPGHKHFKALAEAVKYGILEKGGIPLEFCTIGPCDGWANGNEGMRYILPQREVIADSIELMVEAHRLDAMVTISGCDKINPAVLMAAIRLDIPTICVPGGPNMYEIRFKPDYNGIESNNYDDFEHKLNCITCATHGSCEIMGTANTMQCLMEGFGMTLPNAATIPSMTRMKYLIAKNSGRQIIELLKKDLIPSKIMTKESLHNALILNLAIGGSTNSALHLPAIAHEMGINFDLEIFNEYNQTIPTIVNISPSGDYGMVDLYKAGGIPGVMTRIKNHLNLDCLTVSGRSLKKQIRRIQILNEDIIRPIDNPVHPQGGIAILKGNLAPEGAVIKQSAIKDEKMLNFKGPAVCFDSEIDVLKALAQQKISNGSVIIIRYEGPKGGPGMPELLAVTATLMLRKDLDKVALITDGRFSGATSGPCIGHVSPEAYVGGPIAILENGDIIEINISARSINVNLSEDQIRSRIRNWKPIEKDIQSKSLLKYRKLVSSAAKGAIFRF